MSYSLHHSRCFRRFISTDKILRPQLLRSSVIVLLLDTSLPGRVN